ncbi:hypothetical protein SEPCBS57363_001400 [Sporothrix epigloea]|uniref:Acyltransferase 3 domain-containing protein n=1 Tax=Sporothrix epigloea TaxID=1892477 RepID=A0ABP0DBQ8_9PEZI
MANASLRGLRRWASNQIMPMYDRLPITDQMDENDLKHDTTVEVASVSGRSDSSSSSSRSSVLLGHDHMRHNRPFLARLLHLITTALRNLCTGLISLPIFLLRLLLLPFRLGKFRSFFSPPSHSLSTPAPSHTPVGPGRWHALFAQLEEFQLLVPSFLHPVAPGTPLKKLHPTAYLDGLRGVAAFLVVWHHASLLWFTWSIHRGYASDKDANWLIQLPFLRLAIAGPPQVSVFFVISGYALSYKPLRLSRQGRLAEAGEAIHSGVFRRHMRLFLMPLLVSLVAALLTYLDLYGGKDWKGVAISTRRPPQASSLWGQLSHWARSFITMANPISASLNRGRLFMYDQNEWTLPVEFDMSMMLFLCQAALNRTRPRIRMMVMSCLAVFAVLYIHWQAFLFFSGMILCDLHFEFEGLGVSSTARPAAERPVSVGTSGIVEISPTGDHGGPIAAGGATVATAPSIVTPSTSLAVDAASSASRSQRQHRRWTICKYICFVACLYLLSIPEDGHAASKTPGYITLVQWLPKFHKSKHALDNWYIPLAAVGLVFTIDRTPTLQRIFTHPFPQYLGYISYSMYLIHGTVIFTIGHWAARKAAAVTGTGTQWQYGLAVSVSAIVVWTVTVILSDLATRTIDARAVSLGRVIYERWSQLGKEQADLLPRTRQ